LETFIGTCPSGMECRHLDGNPRNNKLDNLCWGTHSNNMKDRTKHGNFNWLKPNNRGELHGKAKLNNWIIRIIKQLLKQDELSQKEIGQIFKIGQSEISNINTGKRWGYIKNES
jgi:predicted XRE-type DNA-binding protein